MNRKILFPVIILFVGKMRSFKAVFIGAQFKYRSVNDEFPDDKL